MASLEDRLTSWTGPSSDNEQERQERTERMVREAVSSHAAFDGFRFRIYAKGSYANNTNVRADSDVDIVVQCQEVEYWREESPGVHPPGRSYSGIWTPTALRTELGRALSAKFPGQVDSSGSTAFHIDATSSRVDADVVPAFDYRYYFSSGGSRTGSRIFQKSGPSIVNYPDQHLEKGKLKNNATNTAFKKTVRIMKRTENAMVAARVHDALASYCIECLVYNCPSSIFGHQTWTEVVRQALLHIWSGLEGPEPSQSNQRWVEVNECKYLFSSAQPWTREQGRGFVAAAWSYLGHGS
jgi:hypothetical protein